MDVDGDGFEFFSFSIQDQCTVVGDEGVPWGDSGLEVGVAWLQACERLQEKMGSPER